MHIIEQLRETAIVNSKLYDDNKFVIRGLWRSDLLFKPTANERTFNYTYILAQTLGHGCCYCEEGKAPPQLDGTLMGQDAREVQTDDIYTKIAILDAIYSVFEKKASSRFVISGSSLIKTVRRTKIVINEVLKELGHQQRPKVVNVGAVGNFIAELQSKKVTVFATDLDSKLVGRELCGVIIEHGDQTLKYIQECNVALVSGMTLATGTLEAIIETAKKSNTKLIMFCETGANFAEEYCKYGVDVVISEPFPFYIFQGISKIEVFRA